MQFLQVNLKIKSFNNRNLLTSQRVFQASIKYDYFHSFFKKLNNLELFFLVYLIINKNIEKNIFGKQRKYKY